MLVERLRSSALSTPFPGARGDHVVEGGIGLDEIVGAVAGRDHAVELGSKRAAHLGVGALGGEGRRLRLEHAPHLEQLEDGPSLEEVGRGERRLEQLTRVEAR